MKRALLFTTFIIASFWVRSQEQFKISFDDYQMVENSSTSLKSQIKFPFKGAMAVMSGLNDLDGMKNYFNIFGSKLIVQQQSINSDSSRSLLLRSEDGRNFYDLFPNLSAKLTSLASIGNDESLAD